LNSFLRGVRLAFDVGKARIGVAKCDIDGIIASPVVTISRADDDSLKNQLQKLIEAHNPVEMYFGFPSNLRNEMTLSTRDSLHVAAIARELSNVPIFMIDERLTTSTAASQLREQGRTAKNSKSIIDQQAACIILESALLSLKNHRKAGVEFDEF